MILVLFYQGTQRVLDPRQLVWLTRDGVGGRQPNVRTSIPCRMKPTHLAHQAPVGQFLPVCAMRPKCGVGHVVLVTNICCVAACHVGPLAGQRAYTWLIAVLVGSQRKGFHSHKRGDWYGISDSLAGPGCDGSLGGCDLGA